jgi:hypothetical protein
LGYTKYHKASLLGEPKANSVLGARNKKAMPLNEISDTACH